MPPEDKKDQNDQQTDNQNQGDDNQSGSTLPKKLEGKSPEELATMYLDLEKKMGESSEELGQLREYRTQTAQLYDVIWSDPELYRDIKGRLQGKTPEKPPEGDDKKTEDKKDDQQDQTQTPQPKPKDDVRRYNENRILAEFETRAGLDKLPTDQRKAAWLSISNTMSSFLDPNKERTPNELLGSIDLDKLPGYLDNAFKVSFSDEQIKKAREEGKMARNNQDSGMIGSLSSSGEGEDNNELPLSKRAVAGKLGIKEEDYAEAEEQLNKQAPLIEPED